MADLGASSWSEVDASNNAVPPDGWPEGMAPSDVNNAARSQMGGEKRWWDRSNATQTTTGTSTALVLTYAATEAALYDGEETSFVLHVTCGAAPTLNRDGLGAKALRKFDFATNAFIAVAASDFRINQVLRVRYNLAADRYDIIAVSLGSGVFGILTANNTFTGTNTFSNTVTMSGAVFNEAHGANIASAATINLDTATGNAVDVTGTTAVTAITLADGAERTVRTTGILTWTNGASLVLPTSANITTAAGDYWTFRGYATGVVRMTGYQLASGLPLVVAPNPKIVVIAKATGTTLNKQYNVTSVVKNSTGSFTFNFTTNIDPHAVITAITMDAAQSGDCVIGAQSASAVTVLTYNAGGTPNDFTAIYLTASA